MLDDGEVGVGVDFADFGADLIVEYTLLVPELIDLDEVDAINGVEALDIANGLGGRVGAVVGFEVKEEGAAGPGEGLLGVEGEVEVEEIADGGGGGIDAAGEVFGDIELDEAGEGEAFVGEFGAEAAPVAGGVGGGFDGRSGLIEGQYRYGSGARSIGEDVGGKQGRKNAKAKYSRAAPRGLWLVSLG